MAVFSEQLPFLEKGGGIGEKEGEDREEKKTI